MIEANTLCGIQEQLKDGKNVPPLMKRPIGYLSNDLMKGFKSADNLLLRKAYSMKVSTYPNLLPQSCDLPTML